MVDKITFNRNGIRALMRNPALVSGRTKAIEAACNAQSSWGGYDSVVEVDEVRAVGRVWSYGRNDDPERINRMVRNLDAGG